MNKRAFVRILARSALAAAALASALAPAACAPSDFTGLGPIRAPVQYRRLYPYYAELCAVSGVSKKPGFGAEISGGPGGHSVLYLNGVCRVRDAHYPVIRVCDDPGRGVGVSANAHFSNANWIATDGPDFFFNGALKPGEKLTRITYAQTQQEAERRGILDGVIFHFGVFADQPPTMSRRDFMYEMSVSTDYAIAFGRGRYCVRAPVTRDQMSGIVDYLNARNARYRNGGDAYVWNVLQDNCAHLTHNALAAAGLWPDRPTDETVIRAAFTFPVPMNDFASLLHRANDLPLRDLRAMFEDESARAALMRWNWLPTEPGGLLESAPVWPDNDLYRRDATLIFYQDPFFGAFSHWFDKARAEPRAHDLVANLRYFDALYDKILEERKPLAWWLAEHPGLARSPDDFPAFYAKFYEAVNRSSRMVKAGLRAIPQPAPASGAIPAARSADPDASPPTTRKTPF